METYELQTARLLAMQKMISILLLTEQFKRGYAICFFANTPRVKNVEWLTNIFDSIRGENALQVHKVQNSAFKNTFLVLSENKNIYELKATIYNLLRYGRNFGFRRVLLFGIYTAQLGQDFDFTFDPCLLRGYMGAVTIHISVKALI